MTERDIERLYNLLDQLREEVVGYRGDLNGRLAALEQAEARRRGADSARGSIGRIIVGSAAVAGSAAALVTLLLAQV